MNLKEARELAGFDKKDVERLFGIHDLQHLEAENDDSTGIASILMREFLRTSKNDVGNFAVITTSRSTIETGVPQKSVDYFKLLSKDEAMQVFKKLCEKYVPAKIDKTDRFYEISAWRCTDDWKPEKLIKRIMKEY